MRHQKSKFLRILKFLQERALPLVRLIRAQIFLGETVAEDPAEPDFLPPDCDLLPGEIKDLRAGRLDAVFYDRPALATAAAESGGALAVTPLETREPYGIGVRKGRPDLLEAVNAAIRERNGEGAK